MLRLRAQADTEDVPCVHDPLDPVTTDTLHRVGKELPDSVSAPCSRVAALSEPTADKHARN